MGAAAALLEGLDPAAVAGARWFAGKGGGVGAVAAEDALVLGDGSALVVARIGAERYALLRPRGGGAEEPMAGDGTWTALAEALAAGGERPGVAGGTFAFAPQPALAAALGPERALGADQSNTSVVVGRALLKLVRRLEPGPAVEARAGVALAAAGFRWAPAFLGAATWRPPGAAPAAASAGDGPRGTAGGAGAAPLLAAHAFLPHARDAYETVAEALTAALLAGEPPLGGGRRLPLEPLDPAALGERLAALHAALGRPAPAGDPAAWAAAARADREAAVPLLDPGSAGVVRRLEPAIERVLGGLARRPPPPAQTLHGDLHLGQVLLTDDEPGGPVFIDFEGDPLLPPERRGAPGPPARDVATLLRSLDHVARSAVRRAAARAGEPPPGGRPAVPDAPAAATAWIAAARGALLAAYGPLDLGLLHELEVAKECAELRYAATVLPSWSWAPVSGLQALLGDGS
jgi:predicted trehalose synthase